MTSDLNTTYRKPLRACLRASMLLITFFALACVPHRAYASGMPSVSYSAHVERIGWQGAKANGTTAGTVSRSLRMEALRISVRSDEGLGIAYSAHVQGIGWQAWKSGGQVAGTTGRSRRLEAIRIKLTGSAAANYHVQYRLHVQSFGWLGWAEDGEKAGSSGYARRAEAIQIRIVKASDGSVAKGATGPAFHLGSALSGSEHVQKVGWRKYSSAAVGQTLRLGTTGRSLRVEALRLKVSGDLESGGIAYNMHVQGIGWQSNIDNTQDWRTNGAIAGTTGRARRLEAIQVKLLGNIANHYEIWYRCHIQQYGWLDWTHDGLVAGSFGQSLRLEAIELRLIPKGGERPTQTSTAVIGLGNDEVYVQASANGGKSMRFNATNNTIFLPSWASVAHVPQGMYVSTTANDLGSSKDIRVGSGGTAKVWIQTRLAYPPVPITIMRSANIPMLYVTSSNAKENRPWLESSADHSNI